MVAYIPNEEVLIIHYQLIELTGGLHGVRDVQRILSAVERPKMQSDGKDLYPSLFDKAAVYFESVAFYHPFIDGNKRTAITLSMRFLYLNGYVISASNKKIEKFVLSAVTKKYKLNKISAWLKGNTRRI